MVEVNIEAFVHLPIFFLKEIISQLIIELELRHTIASFLSKLGTSLLWTYSCMTEKRYVMKMIRLGTYNVNNLFDRFDDPYEQSDDPWRREFSARPKLLDEIFNLGERLRKSKLDILVVQEIESYGALREFVSGQLGDKYKQGGVFSLESNDPRGIDLGIISKFPIGKVTTHRFRRQGGDKVFSRDCLEVEIQDMDYSRVLFTLFVLHLKSQYSKYVVGTPDWESDQQVSDGKRQRELENVAEIVKRSQATQGSRYVILGDFNDNPLSNPITWFLENSGLDLVDCLKSIDPAYPAAVAESETKRERDTHKWEKDPEQGHNKTTYSQLDYILLSKTLKDVFTGKAAVEQRGNTGGSDHFLCWAELDIDRIQ